MVLPPGETPAQPEGAQPGGEADLFPAPDIEPRFTGSGRLRGKVAIISGGESGIGRACSILFAREGAQVAILHLEEDPDAQKAAELVEREGGDALVLRGDTGQHAFCDEAVAKVMEEFGQIDVLVNNVPEQYPVPDLTEISEEELERTFRTNVFGYFFLTQAALPHLKRGASIVNTTSITAYRHSPELVDHAATRGAVVAFTRSLAKTLAGRGIRVNAVAPGPIWTPLAPASFDAETVEGFGAEQPLGRPGQPNEVAACHLFLACEDSSYMTGQVLYPNGGETVSG